MQRWRGSHKRRFVPSAEARTRRLVAVAAATLVGSWVLGGAIGDGAVVAKAAAPATPWSLSPSANNIGNNNEISGISCVSSSFCVGVGNYEPGMPRAQVLIETWNGTTWSITPSPNPSNSDDVLTGVSCTSTTSCVAVGYISSTGAYYAISEVWNGTVWSAVTPVNASPAAPYALQSVSCTSSTSCMAIGWYSNASQMQEPLAESWDGSTWTVLSTSALVSTSIFGNGLLSVSCGSSTSCFAVGYQATGASARYPIIASWDGASWSLVAGDGSFTSGGFAAVSCVSATSCMAAGNVSDAAPGGVAEIWNGSAWALTPTPAGGNFIAVSCATSTSCTTVGESSGAPVSDRWNGTSWSPVSMVAQGTYSQVQTLACASATGCMAAGFDHDASVGVDVVLTESWSGTSWSLVPAANQNIENNTLSGVSCTSSTSCVAVGGSFVLGAEQTLTESWNGSAWSIIPSATEAYVDSHLNSISCWTASNCIAVGYYGDTPRKSPLIEQLSGSTWTIVAVPPQGVGDNPLNAVSCVSYASCVAVGYETPSSDVLQTTIDTWNGTAWNIVSSPTPDWSTLSGVWCTSSTTCMAAGSTYGLHGGSTTLIESLSGSSWTVVPSPSEGNGNNALVGMTCAGLTVCTAVGSYDNASGVAQTLVERTTSSGWAIVASPSPSNAASTLTSVSCATSTSCVAVGDSRNSGAVDQSLVEGWDGAAWSTLSSPNEGVGDNALFGVSCFSSASCTAAGTWVDSGIDQTLVETGAAPSPASTTYDDSAVNVAFDTWVGVSNATASGGTYRISGTKSAKAAFTFSGSAVTWITRKGPDQGIASVTIDGILKGAVNLYSGSALASSVSYSGLASGTHKLVITVTGRKGATSTGTNVVIDAFAVGASTTQDFSSAVEYDAWRGAIVTAASGGTERVDVKVGATSTLNFTGTSVQWVTATGPSSGMASVTIDGVSRGTVDLYSSTVHHKVAETYSGLALGSHSVVITVLGTRNALSKGDGVVVDAFIVNA